MPTTSRFGCAANVGSGRANAASGMRHLAIDGRSDPAQLVRHGIERFGMGNEEVAARRQVALEHRDHALLNGAVEIDHDVAAENHVERLAELIDFEEVQIAE